MTFIFNVSGVNGDSGTGGGALKFVVVDTLPETGKNGVVYLVPVQDETGRNKFKEFIWIKSRQEWEQLGYTDIDLTQYVTKEELQTALNNYYTKTVIDQKITEIQTAIESKLDKKPDGENFLIVDNLINKDYLGYDGTKVIGGSATILNDAVNEVTIVANQHTQKFGGIVQGQDDLQIDLNSFVAGTYEYQGQIITDEFKKEHPYTARMALAQIIIDHANTIALACQTSKVFEIYLELTATLLSRDLGYNLNAKKGDPDHIASVLQTTEKTIVGAINEVNKKVDDLLIDISQQIASAIAEHDADENAHFSLFQRVKQIWESV